MIGLRTTIIVAVGLLLVIGVLQWDRRQLKSEIKNFEAQIVEKDLLIAGMQSKEEMLEALRKDAADIASLGAEACRKTINFRVKHTIESQDISNAPDTDTAAAAYDRLLCGRPEAAGHPKCARADAAPE